MKILLGSISLFISLITSAYAEKINIAVASNFAPVAELLAQSFEAQTGHHVTLIPGATGKHYAQIYHGAPFDLFLAADSERPRRLEENGLTVTDSRFTYAIGKLVLWSPEAGLIDPDGQVLRTSAFRHIAIANPKLAPYGRAAQQVIEQLNASAVLKGRTVKGENIGQTYQFVASGNASLGFVALSQLKQNNRPIAGSYWIPPQNLYQPIEQQAVLLKESRAARAFLEQLKSKNMREIIQGFGYDTP